MRKEVLSVYLDPPQLAELRAIHEQTKVPVAVYIRDAVAEWLKRREAAAQRRAR